MRAEVRGSAWACGRPGGLERHVRSHIHTYCALASQPHPGHNYIGHNFRGHNYIGHNYIGHDYIVHNYTGHNYIVTVASQTHMQARTVYKYVHAHACTRRLWHGTGRCPTVPAHNYIGYNYTGHNYKGHKYIAQGRL